MGGGKLTRPDFGRSTPAPEHPMTEFYLLLLAAVEQEKWVAAPGCRAEFRPPWDRQIYPEDMAEYCRFTAEEKLGLAVVLEPTALLVEKEELCVLGDGTPAALFLECRGRERVALRLLPPFGGVELGAAPKDVALLQLELTVNDLLLADTDPQALGHSLCARLQGKRWESHPAIDRWSTMALAAAQKAYRNRQ